MTDSTKQQKNLSDSPSDIIDKVAKYKIKDSVFANLFNDKKYLFQLYKAFHPEDTNATEEQLNLKLWITSMYFRLAMTKLQAL